MIVGYLAALAAFAVVDAVWITQIALPMFKTTLGATLRDAPDLVAAVLFYVIYMAGVTLLAIRPAVTTRSATLAIQNGAVLGLTAYATFDLTSLAVFRGWTWQLALWDMAWGTLATGFAAVVGYTAAARASRSEPKPPPR